MRPKASVLAIFLTLDLIAVNVKKGSYMIQAVKSASQLIDVQLMVETRTATAMVLVLKTRMVKLGAIAKLDSLTMVLTCVVDALIPCSPTQTASPEVGSLSQVPSTVTTCPLSCLVTCTSLRSQTPARNPVLV